MKNKIILSTYFFFIFSLISCGPTREKRETFFRKSQQLSEQFEVIKNTEGSYIKDGSYKEWYKTGQIKISGFYQNGKKSDTWKTWGYDGARKTNCEYEGNINLSLQGRWKSISGAQYNFMKENLILNGTDTVKFNVDETIFNIGASNYYILALTKDSVSLIEKESEVMKMMNHFSKSPVKPESIILLR